jgi:hypothetical protein
MILILRFNNEIPFGNKVERLAFNFDSHMLNVEEGDILGAKRNLEVTNRLVVPVNVPFRLVVTSVTFYIHLLYQNLQLKWMQFRVV